MTSVILSGALMVAAAAAFGRAAPADEQRLQLEVYPPISSAPATLRVTAIVERHEANRNLTMSAECPIYMRRSTMPLDGEAAARVHSIHFDSLPACTYDVSATLHRNDGEEITEVRTAQVLK